MAAVPTAGAVRSLAGSSSSSRGGGSRMVWREAYRWRRQGTCAAGGGLRLAALAASVAYLTLNLNDFVRHMEQMPYSGEATTVPPSAVVESVERGDRVYISEVASAARQGRLLPPSHPDVLLVRRIGEAVLAGMEAQPLDDKAGERLRGLRWEFEVVQQGDGEGSAERPLYVSPAGKVLVRTGLLDSLQRDEDTLAFLLAHEVAHVALGTEATGIASERCLQGVAFVAGATCLCYGMPFLMAALGTAGLVWAFHTMMPRPWTWEHMCEPDALASDLTVRAGFDPLPAVGYLLEQHKAAAQGPDSLGLRRWRRYEELYRLISAIGRQYEMEATYVEAWGLRQAGRAGKELEDMERRRARLNHLSSQWGDALRAVFKLEK